MGLGSAQCRHSSRVLRNAPPLQQQLGRFQQAGRSPGRSPFGCFPNLCYGGWFRNGSVVPALALSLS